MKMLLADDALSKRDCANSKETMLQMLFPILHSSPPPFCGQCSPRHKCPPNFRGLFFRLFVPTLILPLSKRVECSSSLQITALLGRENEGLTAANDSGLRMVCVCGVGVWVCACPSAFNYAHRDINPSLTISPPPPLCKLYCLRKK